MIAPRTALDLLDVLKVEVTLYPKDLTKIWVNGHKPPDDVLADLATHKSEILFRLLLRQWCSWVILEADGTPCIAAARRDAVDLVRYDPRLAGHPRSPDLPLDSEMSESGRERAAEGDAEDRRLTATAAAPSILT